MNTAARLLRAAVPNPPRILGLQLKPYSLGHDLILTALENKFLEADRSIDDLFIGVFVCSQSWSEWGRWSNSRWLPVSLRIWRWFIRTKDIRDAFNLFENYLELGRDCPDINMPVAAVGKASSFGSPWQERLKIFLVCKLGLTENEAMNRPLALSNFDWACHGEMDKTLELFSEKDEALLAFHRNRLAAEKPEDN